jgi:hypothetical protein
MNYKFSHLNTVKMFICTLLLLSPILSFGNSLNDKERFLITVSRFESAIQKLNKNIDKKNATRLGTLIAIESKKTKIDPRIFLAIINTESSFNQKAFNKNKDKFTGKVNSVDVSLAQINSKAWSEKSFKFRTGKNLDSKKLKENDSYAIWAMGEILIHFKKENMKFNPKHRDKWWFANYHSYTPQYKKQYISSLMRSFRQLKPFGRNLLRDMPELNQLSKIHSENSSVEVASSGGLYETHN